MNLNDLIEKAKSKDEDAMYILASLYLKGEKGVEKNIKKAYQLFEDSANLGKSASFFELAKIHMTNDYGKRDTEKSIKLLSQSSKKGHSKSSYELGLIYYNGLDVDKDIERAESFLRLAAISEVEPIQKAQLLMANIYENGLLIGHVDQKESYRFYLMAANLGDSFAQYKVGNFLISGLNNDLIQNIEEGIGFLKKSSESGEKRASLVLAKFFLEESKKLLNGIKKDDLEVEYVLNSLSEINTDLL